MLQNVYLFLIKGKSKLRLTREKKKEYYLFGETNPKSVNEILKMTETHPPVAK